MKNQHFKKSTIQGSNTKIYFPVKTIKTSIPLKTITLDFGL